METFRQASHAACLLACERFERGKSFDEQMHGVLDMYHAAAIYGRLARVLLDGADIAAKTLADEDVVSHDGLRAMYSDARGDAEEQLLGVAVN